VSYSVTKSEVMQDWYIFSQVPARPRADISLISCYLKKSTSSSLYSEE